MSAPLERDQLVDHLALALTPGVGPVRLRTLIDRFGSADAVRRAGVASLQSCRGVGERTAQAIAGPQEAFDRKAREELEAIERAGARLLVRGEEGYPSLLAGLPDAPSILTVRGALSPDASALGPEHGPIAIVGSRACTHYGVEQTGRFARAFAGAGCSVISGGARGIDGAAHRAALDAGGHTVAVLGCGLSHCYPPEHADLFEAMVASGRGALVSELPMATAPAAENFPARNRIISGMSLAVLVVEAGRRSGALITARVAVEEHGRDTFAVPGRIGDVSSTGALELIRGGGAAIATEPKDVIEAVSRTAPIALDRVAVEDESVDGGVVEASPRVSDDPVVRSLLEGRSFDEIVENSGLSAAELRAKLTHLEITGVVTRTQSGYAAHR